MDSNVFNKIFISQFNKNHFLDSSFMVNDSIFESNYIHPFYIENAINPIQIKESYLNDSNNLELNNNQIISDTTKPFGEMNSWPKKVIMIRLSSLRNVYENHRLFLFTSLFDIGEPLIYIK